MAHKLIIHDTVAVEREVEIPEVCPKCSTPLHDEDHPVREWDLHDVQHVNRFESAESNDMLTRCDEDDGDTFLRVAVYCECGYCFEEGSLIVLQPDNPRGNAIRAVIDLER